jgi:C-methyltransferase
MKPPEQQIPLAVAGPPKALLAQMSRLYVVSRAIHAIAELGVADLIGDTPISVAEIAANKRLDSGFLARTLRYLAAYGVFEETSPGWYVATETSRLIRDDHPESMRPMLRMVSNEWWNAAGNLADVLRSGNSGFRLVHGTPFFPYLRQHPQLQARFDEGMSSISRIDDRRLAGAYDFAPFPVVVDLAGGKGNFLKEALQGNDRSKGVLFEQPHVLDGPTMVDALVQQGRVRLVPGNLFEALPPSGDAYVIKGTLHDFADPDVVVILRNCAAVMGKGSRLLVIEQLLPSQNEPHPNSTMDMVMMFLLGGKQRALSEWKELAESSGLELIRTIPTDTNYTYLELSLPGRG